MENAISIGFKSGLWRQAEEPAAAGFEGLCGADIFVGAEVVQDDDRPRLKSRRELGFDVGGEGFAIHRTLDDPWRDERVRRQRCDEGLCAPSPEGRRCVQPLSLPGAASQPGHVRLHRRLIDERQSVRLRLHGWLTPRYPVPASAGDISAASLVRHQRLFLYVKPRRRSARAVS